jgi:hypothetical protein
LSRWSLLRIDTNMNVHLIASAIDGSSTSTVGSAYSLIEAMRDNNNRNNIGTVQMVHLTGSGATIKVQGSADGGTNWIDLATGITASTGKTLALMPSLRAAVTGASGAASTVSVYIVQ